MALLPMHLVEIAPQMYGLRFLPTLLANVACQRFLPTFLTIVSAIPSSVRRSRGATTSAIRRLCQRDQGGKGTADDRDKNHVQQKCVHGLLMHLASACASGTEPWSSAGNAG
jgi:hypothetical protein